MGPWDIFPIAVNIQMLVEILNWIGNLVYGAPGSTTVTITTRVLVSTGFLIGMLSISIYILTSAGREKLGPYFRHIIITMVIITGAFNIPVRLTVHDLILERVHANPNIAWTTNNIPLGIGFPIWLTSQFEFIMTQLIDNTLTENFVPPAVTADADYLKLSIGGSVGALGNIMLGLHNVSAQDPRLVVNTMTFTKECVVPAVALRVLPAGTMSNADDLMASIAANLLLNYYADYEQADGTIVTLSCDQFYLNRLTVDIVAAQPSIHNSFIRAGFPSKRLAPGAFDITASLMTAAQSTMRSSFNNAALSGNSVVLNAWFGRMIDLAVAESLGGGDPLIQAMSERVREFKAERSAAGILALTWLPKIKGTLLCLLCVLWFPLIPFMFFHNNKVLISWLAMLFWLSLWGVILTIINAIYTHDLVNALVNSAPTLAGLNAVTFGNRFAIWNAAAESLSGMGLLVSWVIPLSGILMGWLSRSGFGGAGASHAVEQQLNSSTRGTGNAVTTEGAHNIQSKNTEAVMVSGGGKFGLKPDHMANYHQHNFGQSAARGHFTQMYGWKAPYLNTLVESMQRIGRNVGSNGGLDATAQALNYATRDYGANWTAETASRFLEETSIISGNLGSSVKAFEELRHGLNQAFSNMDRQSGEFRKNFEKTWGISTEQLQEIGTALTNDAQWMQKKDLRENVAYALAATETIANTDTYGHSKTAEKFGHRALKAALHIFRINANSPVDIDTQDTGNNLSQTDLDKLRKTGTNPKSTGRYIKTTPFKVIRTLGKEGVKQLIKGLKAGGSKARLGPILGAAAMVADLAGTGADLSWVWESHKKYGEGYQRLAQAMDTRKSDESVSSFFSISGDSSDALREAAQISQKHHEKIMGKASETSSDIYSFQQTQQEMVALEQAKNASTGLSDLVTASFGENAKPRFFMYAAQNGFLPGINKSNLNENQHKANKEFVALMQDPKRKRPALILFLMHSRLISGEAADLLLDGLAKIKDFEVVDDKGQPVQFGPGNFGTGSIDSLAEQIESYKSTIMETMTGWSNPFDAFRNTLVGKTALIYDRTYNSLKNESKPSEYRKKLQAARKQASSEKEKLAVDVANGRAAIKAFGVTNFVKDIVNTGSRIWKGEITPFEVLGQMFSGTEGTKESIKNHYDEIAAKMRGNDKIPSHLVDKFQKETHAMFDAFGSVSAHGANMLLRHANGEEFDTEQWKKIWSPGLRIIKEKNQVNYLEGKKEDDPNSGVIWNEGFLEQDWPADGRTPKPKVIH